MGSFANRETQSLRTAARGPLPGGVDRAGVSDSISTPPYRSQGHSAS